MFRDSTLLFPAYLIKMVGKKWGYIDHQGRFILWPQFDEAGDFQENGLAIVKVDEKAGLIDRKGQYVVKPEYSSIMPFTEGRAIVMDGEDFKVINPSGLVVTKKAYHLIQPFQEQRAIFAESNSEGTYLYGYLDKEGNEVVTPTFLNAYDFTNGKALVQIKENEFALINHNGEIIQTYPFAFMMGYSEGIIPFKKTFNDKWGYVDENGRILLEPQYESAQPFQSNRAIVNMNEGIENQYGLIDKHGNFLIPPKYNDIRQLGAQRVAVGIAINPNEPYVGSRYAIADTNGQLLSEFVYDYVGDYKDGLSFASTNQRTFFIDRSGKAVESYPVFSGVGTLILEGEELIQANLDHRLAYYDTSGKKVYKPNTSFPLNLQYLIRIRKYNPNKDYLVYFPQLEGMQSKNSQKRVNDVLKEKSKVISIPSDVQLDYSYYGDFSVSFFKDDLLVIKLEGYHYPFGAAHGMPYQAFVHIDLSTGMIYELEDLFKRNSDYVEVLSEMIKNQIEEEEKQGFTYYFPDQYQGIKPEQPFYVTEDGLAIYFEPYEIAAFAAGFPTFNISYDELMEIIEVNGAFWRSFHR